MNRNYFDRDLFSRRLKGLLDEKKAEGINSSEISKDCHMSRTALSGYANGHTDCSASSLFELARYFEVSADYLLGLTDVRSSNLKTRQICEQTGLSEASLEGIKSILLSPDGFQKNSFLMEKLLPAMNIITANALESKLFAAREAALKFAIANFEQRNKTFSPEAAIAANQTLEVSNLALRNLQKTKRTSGLDPESERMLTDFDLTRRAFNSIQDSLESVYQDTFNYWVEQYEECVEDEYKDALALLNDGDTALC